MADGGISAFAIAGLVLSAVGTAVGVAGTLAQADSQAKAQDYNAKVSENNAIQAKQQSEFEATRVREKGLRLLSAQKAAYGKSGVDLTGSAGDVLLDTSFSNELDALAVEYGGNVGANRYTAEAGLNSMSAANARRAGYYSAGSTLLTGLGSMASTGLDMYKTPAASTYRPPSVPATPAFI